MYHFIYKKTINLVRKVQYIYIYTVHTHTDSYIYELYTHKYIYIYILYSHTYTYIIYIYKHNPKYNQAMVLAAQGLV